MVYTGATFHTNFMDPQVGITDLCDQELRMRQLSYAELETELLKSCEVAKPLVHELIHEAEMIMVTKASRDKLNCASREKLQTGSASKNG